jgi:hypothetical protein
MDSKVSAMVEGVASRVLLKRDVEAIDANNLHKGETP